MNTFTIVHIYINTYIFLFIFYIIQMKYHSKRQHSKRQHSKRQHSKRQHSKRQHSKRQHSKRQHSKRQHSKRQHSKDKSYKGGDKFTAQPFNSYGFENGASSPRESALLHEKNNNAMQHKMNQMSGGKRSRGKRSRGKRSRGKRSRSKRSRSKRSRGKRSRSKRSGGKRSRKQYGGADVIQVPTFPPVGGIKQAYSSTDLSVGGNTNLVKGVNDSQGDCFATDTCTQLAGGTKYAKRRRITKRRL